MSEGSHSGINKAGFRGALFWRVVIFVVFLASVLIVLYINKPPTPQATAEKNTATPVPTGLSKEYLSSLLDSSGYLKSVNFSQLVNAPENYLDYRPNNIQCDQNTFLKYDKVNSRWICGLPEPKAATSTTATTAQNLTTNSFSSPNISQWTNDANYLTSVNVSQLGNGSNLYLDYRPNNLPCSDSQTLKYNNAQHRWLCADNTSGGSPVWGNITGLLSTQTDLAAALAAKLNSNATAGGDVTGTFGNLQVTDDSHNHTGASISGLGAANFTSSNISQWTNDANYLSSVNASQIQNGSNVYLDYRPNNTACNESQVLKYNATLHRWLCADDNNASSPVWGAIGGSIVNQTDLNSALTAKLNANAAFGGDISGTYDNLSVANDSHSHTGATISGLGTSNFTSANISQWTNDANYLTSVDVSQVQNGSGKYFDYRPNNTTCAANQSLIYDATNHRWTCGAVVEDTSWKIDPDKPPASPNAMDDEFNGASVDPKWQTYTDVPAGNYNIAIDNGSLKLEYPTTAANSYRHISVFQNAPAGTWKFRAKFVLEGPVYNYWMGGLEFRSTGQNKTLLCALVHQSSYGVALDPYVGKFTGYALSSEWDSVDFFEQTFYMEAEYDGTNLNCKLSRSGNHYTFMFSEPVTTFLGAAPNQIGITLHPYSTTPGYFIPSVYVDWFRRVQ